MGGLRSNHRGISGGMPVAASRIAHTSNIEPAILSERVEALALAYGWPPLATIGRWCRLVPITISTVECRERSTGNHPRDGASLYPLTPLPEFDC